MPTHPGSFAGPAAVGEGCVAPGPLSGWLVMHARPKFGGWRGLELFAPVKPPSPCPGLPVRSVPLGAEPGCHPRQPPPPELSPVPALPWRVAFWDT